MDKIAAWEKIHFDALFHGDDWKGSDMYDEVEKRLSEVGVDMVFLPHTTETSSTMLKDVLQDLGELIINSRRIEWIDCAKGITMLLVIFGHTVSRQGTEYEQLIRGAIFSFHMPLFFILSCVTFRLSESQDQFVSKTRRAFKHLVIPAVILFLLRMIIYIVQNFHSIVWKTYLAEKINVLVFSSGVNVHVLDATIPKFGMMWFLIVLFIGRSLFDYFHLILKKRNFYVAVFSCAIGGGNTWTDTMAAAFF